VETQTQNQATLGDLFPVSSEELKQRLSSELERSENSGSLAGSIRESVLGEAVRRFAELLDVQIADIMVGGMSKYASLIQYTNKTKYPPSESVLASLNKLKIESNHTPGIDVMLNEKLILPIKLKVNLALIIESMTLRIQDGRIREIRTGQVKAEGAVKLGDAVLVERKSSPVRLPGTIDLGYGIAILP